MKRKRVKAKLRLFPDPILTQVCEPVRDGEDVSGIIRDMMHILTNGKSGIGLAAPQAGHLKRIILFRFNGSVHCMVNPEISRFCRHSTTAKEGCLSYPDREEIDISRANGITVGYRHLPFTACVSEFSNFTARIIQHEIDHLDGKCKVGEQ